MSLAAGILGLSQQDLCVRVGTEYESFFVSQDSHIYDFSEGSRVLKDWFTLCRLAVLEVLIKSCILLKAYKYARKMEGEITVQLYISC